MEMTGEERIALPRPVVWAALNDPDVLKQCIYGCRSLEWVSDHELTALVTIRLGLLSASFTGLITLSNVEPPERYTISAEGKGGLAGFAKGGADVVLREDGDATILHYSIRAQTGGRLAKLGHLLVSSSAKKLAETFFADFTAAAQAKAAA